MDKLITAWKYSFDKLIQLWAANKVVEIFLNQEPEARKRGRTQTVSEGVLEETEEVELENDSNGVDIPGKVYLNELNWSLRRNTRSIQFLAISHIQIIQEWMSTALPLVVINLIYKFSQA